MANFTYKRINRGGKYYNSVFKDGQFYHFEKWNKDHHKAGAIERAKIKRWGQREQKKEIRQRIPKQKKEYESLKNALRERVKVDWNDIRTRKGLRKILKESELAGENTFKRQQAVKRMMGIEFKRTSKKLNMSFFKVKGKKTMRYRNPKTGRFAKP